jgi:hypothetical protein
LNKREKTMTDEKLKKLIEPLLMNDRRNESNVIAELIKIPADEREDLVRLITAPETRQVMNDRRNADDAIKELAQTLLEEQESYD